MPDPISNLPQVRKLLIEYLTNETTQFFPDIRWDYYQVEHDATLPPYGAVYLGFINTDSEFPGNVNVEDLYEIRVILRISKATTEELLDSLYSWADQLKSTTFKKLACDGYQGYFKGIRFRPRNSIVPRELINQDQGGRGVLELYLWWKDESAAASNNPFAGKTFGS